MKRTSIRKGMERRKRPRTRSSSLSARNESKRDAGSERSASTSATRGRATGIRDGLASSDAKSQTNLRRSPNIIPGARVGEDFCHNCNADLGSEARVLFVEEELRRTFCSESCITEYFGPETLKLEKDYLNRLKKSDFSAEQRESLAHLRWTTLQEPDEIWTESWASGDQVYTMISEFHPGAKRVWCVCICLCLRGDPSFLFMAFPTRDPDLVEFFRKGQKLDLAQRSQGSVQKGASEVSASDGLANSWTEDETIRARLGQDRREDDIPIEEYESYHGCVDVSLQNPDEVWSIVLFEAGDRHLYHFIKFFPNQGDQGSDEGEGFWYLVIARETEDRDQIEILEAFPTRDSNLVQRYRTGVQEVGNANTSEHRVIH